MTIIEVAHVIRAAATITKQDEFVIIGSQSILGSYPNIDDETITRSPELDIYPKQYREDLADQISGALGANSPFHENFGYYADGVSPDTATLPLGWEDRLVLVADMESMATRDGRKPKAYFLEPHDLLCAKFAAAREKDYEFCEAAIAKGIAKSDVLMARLESTQMPENKLALAKSIAEMAFNKREREKGHERTR